jgi:hypothetical protein
LEEKLELLLPSPKSASLSHEGGGRGFDDETGDCSEPEKWTIIRDDNLYIRHLRREIEKRAVHRDAVKVARERLDDTEEQFITLFYDQNRTVRDCKRIMSYEKSKIYDLRQKVVYKVACYVGLL